MRKQRIISMYWKLKGNLWTHTHTHTRLTALFPGLPRWAGTRKVKPIWILVKQETVSSSGISWAVCKSAPRSRQTTTPAPHHSVFYRPDALPVAQPTASKHWRHIIYEHKNSKLKKQGKNISQTYFVFLSPVFFVASSITFCMSGLRAFTSSSVVVKGRFFMNNVFLGFAVSNKTTE